MRALIRFIVSCIHTSIHTKNRNHNNFVALCQPIYNSKIGNNFGDVSFSMQINFRFTKQDEIFNHCGLVLRRNVCLCYSLENSKLERCSDICRSNFTISKSFPFGFDFPEFEISAKKFPNMFTIEPHTTLQHKTMNEMNQKNNHMSVYHSFITVTIDHAFQYRHVDFRG